MSFEGVFRPAYGQGVLIAATTTSSSTSITTGKNIVVTNSGVNDAYMSISDEPLTATSADYLLLAGSQVSLDADFQTNLNVVSIGGDTSIHVIAGVGA